MERQLQFPTTARAALLSRVIDRDAFAALGADERVNIGESRETCFRAPQCGQRALQMVPAATSIMSASMTPGQSRVRGVLVPTWLKSPVAT
jgi:hypothetical protein